MAEQHRRETAVTVSDPKDRRYEPGGDAMYSGALSFCRVPFARDLAGADVAVIGVPFDTSVTGRPGCRFGPRAVRAASAHLAWERAWPSAFDPFQRLAVVDWGDIYFDQGRPEAVPAKIEAAIAHVIGTATAPGPAALLLGGDHFTTYPSLKAHAAKHGAPLSLIQFDAHSDTWGAEGEDRIDHGTMFRRAAEEGIIDPAFSVQIGLRTTNDETMGFHILDGDWVQDRGCEAAVDAIRDVVGDRKAYVTFDIDCLDPAYAPGTGTPVCGGLTTWQARRILRGLAGLSIVGADVVEVSPAYDHAEVTALAAATLALDMLCLFAESPGVEASA